MGSNTKIYLNNHAKTEDVFKVILKIVGNDFTQSNSSGSYVNKNKPSSDGNGWSVKFPKDEDNQISYPKMGSIFNPYFNFYFKDCIGEKHSCMFFFEGYESEYAMNGEKTMNPDSSPLWGAIGKRLVDFFGGKVLFSDSADSDNPDNWYVCDNPKYPAKVDGQSSNARWHLYQNALFNEPILKAQEIKDMYDRTRYNDREETRQLINYLEKYEAAEELAQTLSVKKGNKINTKKMKV
jgi:hypothetical protein